MDSAELVDRYQAATAAGDEPAVVAALHELTKVAPEIGWVWFDLGLRAKWRRDWPECVRLNATALDLLESTREQPEAWNLGIAATALGDWTTARRAWEAYGVPMPAGDGEPNGRFGITPVRLNAEPRNPGEPWIEIDGERRSTEVVWGDRLDPARVRIFSVPLPESGHRFGDVVLHDGEPVGKRRFGDRDYSVFNEITVLTRSPLPTLTVHVTGPAPNDIEDLGALFGDLGFEDWTGSLEPMCKQCSEGTPDPTHHHHEDTWRPDRRLGLAAPVAEASRLLAEWAAAGSGRRYEGLSEG